MPRLLLVASKTGYQVREFSGAAARLGVDLVLVTDRCHVLDDPWGDQAAAISFDRPEESPELDALAARAPFGGILAVGDKPAWVGAIIAERLGLRFHPAAAVRAAGDKYRTRDCFQAAGLNVPAYRLIMTEEEIASWNRYPSVLKPLHLSASRGVIRANNPDEFRQAFARIRKITGNEPVLAEDFIPGREFALEGILTAGKLQTLAIFDKPDPLDGPYFEETIYLTPSRETEEVQQAIHAAAQEAAAALGLKDGPMHAEMRVNPRGVWMLEAAARPIGGLCSRVLRFKPDSGDEPASLEEVLLLHALGRDVRAHKLVPEARGVMMIPIPSAGIYAGVEGLEPARQTADIEAVEVTAKEGQQLERLPEGHSYLGFLFSQAHSAEDAERALRAAHACLTFKMLQSLPVVR